MSPQMICYDSELCQRTFCSVAKKKSELFGGSGEHAAPLAYISFAQHICTKSVFFFYGELLLSRTKVIIVYIEKCFQLLSVGKSSGEIFQHAES